MRSFTAAAAGLALVLSAHGARAIEPEIITPAASAPASAAPAPEAPAVAVAAPAAVNSVLDDPGIVALVRQKLPVLKSAAVDGDARDRAALAAYYAETSNGLAWVSKNGLTAKGTSAVAEIGKAGDWGLTTKSFDLPTIAASAEGAPPLATDVLAAAEIKLSLAALKYARHARGGRIPDPAKQLSSYLDRTPQLVEPGIVIASIVKADDPAAYLRGLHPKHPQFEKLRQRYLELKAALGTATPAAKAPAGPVTKTGPKIAASETGDAAKMRSLLANMEMWRWIPEDMGALHVWVNLPEFTLRVMKNGAAIHTERIISGLKDKQTPNFSATMETVVFHPYWSIPESIKVKDIYPSFARGGTVAKRYNLRVAQNGRLIDPSTVDWSQADIRRYDVYQPPGEGNMMGVLKFLFPNKHQTYMHDTPDKALFDQPERTFSHGCMRVRNPVSLAEVILAEDKGWDAAKIKELAQPGVENNAIPLDKKIPVHITYFTEWIGDDGSTIAFNDMYGHERRVTLALEGRFSEIVKGPDHLAPVTYGAARYAQSRKSGDMMHGFLSGGY